MNHAEIASLRIINQQLISSKIKTAEKLVEYFPEDSQYKERSVYEPGVNGTRCTKGS